MYSKVVKGEWSVPSIGSRRGESAEGLTRDANTAAGGPKFGRYSKNPILDVFVKTVCHVKYVTCSRAVQRADTYLPLPKDSPTTDRQAFAVSGSELDTLHVSRRIGSSGTADVNDWRVL